MKKTLFIIASVVMALTSCNNEPSYRITGKAEGIADSTWVYLQEAHGMRLAKLDSAMILNEEFTFNGRQDTTVLRYLSAKPEGGKRQRIDFFLENGNINVNLCGETSATGTPNPRSLGPVRAGLAGFLDMLCFCLGAFAQAISSLGSLLHCFP